VAVLTALHPVHFAARSGLPGLPVVPARTRRDDAVRRSRRNAVAPSELSLAMVPRS